MPCSLSSRKIYLIISLLSFLSVLGAVLIQKYYSLNPCAICIVARYCLIAIGISNLFIFFLRKPNKKNQWFNKILQFISGAFIFIGLGFSIRHLYIVHQQIDTCKIDKLQLFLNNIPLADIFPTLFQSTGSCLDSNFSFLGIPFTILTFSFYILIILLSLWPLFRKKEL